MKKCGNYIYKGNNAKVAFYEENGNYYMISEDIGKCFNFADPRKQLNNFFDSHPELNSDKCCIFANIPGKRGSKIRCFTRRGVTLLANLKGEREFGQWAKIMFDGLESGALKTEPVGNYEYTNCEQFADQRGSSDTNCRVMSDYERAMILIELSKVASSNIEAHDYKAAARALLFGNDFEKVRNTYLHDYEIIL